MVFNRTVFLISALRVEGKEHEMTSVLSIEGALLYRFIMRRMKKMTERILTKKHMGALRQMVEIQGNSGNYDYDEYMFGMFNGMELMLSTIEDRTPSFKSKPENYINHKEASEGERVDKLVDYLQELRMLNDEGYHCTKEIDECIAEIRECLIGEKKASEQKD